VRAGRKNAFEATLARIEEIEREAPPTAAHDLRVILEDPRSLAANAYLVGEAAKAAMELSLRDLAPVLVGAFEKLCVDGSSRDRGCQSKKKILEALIALEAEEWDTYRKGLAYEQMEVSVGPPVDAGAVVRGLCAHALVRTNAPQAALEVAPLLTDTVPEVRSAAADALADTGETLMAALLHVQMLAGEQDPEVLGACYRGLLRLEPRRYLPVVEGALASGVETAALALGESRLPGALEALQRTIASGAGDMEETTLLGVSLLRTEEALSYLVELVSSAPEKRAVAALEALSLHRHDEKLGARVREIVGKRRSKRLTRAFAEKFGPED